MGPTNTTDRLSLVEQFGTAKEAQSEVDYLANSFKTGKSGAQVKTFTAPGIPGAGAGSRSWPRATRHLYGRVSP